MSKNLKAKERELISLFLISNMQEVIDEMNRYLRDFIEQPSPAFSGFPICPFVHKARTEGKIKYVVMEFSDITPDIESEIASFKIQNEFDLLLFIHPNKQGLSLEQLNTLVNKLSNNLSPDYWVFSGHPNDPTELKGIKFRADPFPTFQIIAKKTVDEARAKIIKTTYYDQMPADLKEKINL